MCVPSLTLPNQKKRNCSPSTIDYEKYFLGCGQMMVFIVKNKKYYFMLLLSQYVKE